MAISTPEIGLSINNLSLEEVERQAERAIKLGSPERNGKNIPFPIIVTLPLKEINILSWLESINRTPKVYWCSRDGQLEIGGIGASLTISEEDPGLVQQKFELIERILQCSAPSRHLGFLGGSNFNFADAGNSEWTSFPTMWFVLPEIFIHRFKDQYSLNISSLFENGASAEYIARKLVKKAERLNSHDSPKRSSALPNIQIRRDLPAFPRWAKNVTESLERIQRGEVEKVVLARRTDLVCSGEIGWVEVARRLKNHNENCFFYCFQPARGIAFLGATPERLFKINERTLVSEAVSGTIARSGTLEEDLESGISLLHSEKNLREHQFVVDAIKKIKDKLCDNIVTHSKPSLLELSNVQHLYTRIAGELREGISLYDLLSTLHPTPAVGGTPRGKALELIRDLEAFDRGWYAGPVGILSQEWSEVVVALRSLLISGNMARIYAGAGIVRGSEPESEWQELESKISIALQIFNGA
jgi:menaquinone-specific isochorismate synthase